MKTELFKLELYLSKWSKEFHPTGSSYICDPPVKNTDIDYLVLVDEGKEESFESAGFWMDYDCKLYENTPQFRSYRKGSINLIVTSDNYFYDKFKKATEKAKRLNLLNKEDRIKLFQEELYGNQTLIDLEEISF